MTCLCLYSFLGISNVGWVPMLMNPAHPNTQIENCSSRRSEKIYKGIYILTHWNDICLCIVHSQIIFSCPCEANLDPTLESWVLISQVLPGSHKHFECGYCTHQNQIGVTQHDLLNTVRDLFPFVRFCLHKFWQVHTSKTTWISDSTNHSMSVIWCFARSLLFRRVRKWSTACSLCQLE